MLTIHKFRVRFSHGSKFISPTFSQKKVVDNGNESVVLVSDLVDIGSSDFSKLTLPDPEEYTYENLIKAGVPLQEVPSKIFDYSEQDLLRASAEFQRQINSSVPSSDQSPASSSVLDSDVNS